MARSAQVRPVTRNEALRQLLAIPRRVASGEVALADSLVEETAFIHAQDQACERNDREFDLPDRRINLLTQWIQHNHDRMPERRRSAAELMLLTPEQIDRVEALVAESFRPQDQAENA